MTTTEETPVHVRWIEALRSGRYEQAKSYLHAGNGFCCLGVLCELVGGAGWEHADDFVTDQHDEHGYAITVPIYATNGVTGMPDDEALMWANLSNHQAENLAHMNDSGKTFAEIADHIEEMYADGTNSYDPAVDD